MTANQRGSGTFHYTHTWPFDEKDLYDKAKVLAGRDGLSAVIWKLIREWVEKEEATLQNIPIGLRYNQDNNNTTSNHWIDSLLEPSEEKVKEQIGLMEDHDRVVRIAIMAHRINQAATKRGKELKDRGKSWLRTNTKNRKLDKQVTSYEDIHIKKNLTISNSKNLVLHSLANHSFTSSLLIL